MHLKKRFEKNAGSWLAEIVNDRGEPLSTAWHATEEACDDWYRKQTAAIGKVQLSAGKPVEFAEEP